MTDNTNYFYRHAQAPKKCSINNQSHNLNLAMYSFQEIMELFQLSNVSTLTEEHMKAARTIALHMHPDKSRLPPDYFIFYKKAFEILVGFYNQQTRETQPVPTEQVDYVPEGRGIGDGLNKATSNRVQGVVNKLGKNFNSKFNQLFDENMLNTQKIKQAEERNQWFTQDTPAITPTNQNGSIHDKFEHIKSKQTSTHLARYGGVQPLYMGRSKAGNLYDDDTDTDQYISADPFSKLQYDDLRKVHKDETIFSVSETDFNKVTQYTSTDQLQQSRAQQNLDPLDKSAAMRRLESQETLRREQFMKREYHAKLQTIQNEEKSKKVMSHFLHLTN